MRGGVAYLAIENAPDIMKRVAEFTSTIRSTRGENFRVIVSSDSVRVIAGQEALDNFRQSFRPRRDYSLHPRTCRNLSPTSIRNGETGRDCNRDYRSTNPEQDKACWNPGLPSRRHHYSARDRRSPNLRSSTRAAERGSSEPSQGPGIQERLRETREASRHFAT